MVECKYNFMNNFDLRVNALLQENILGNIATGVGAALNAAKDPSQGIKTIASGISQLNANKEQLKSQSFSLKNQPKLNQIAVTIAPILGVGKAKPNPKFNPDPALANDPENPKTFPPPVVTIMPNATVFGKVTKTMDSSGNYGIALTDEKGNPSQKYVFSQTEEAPYWQIYDKSKLPIQNIKMEEEEGYFNEPDDGIVRDSNNNPMVLMAIMTGPAKEDVSEPLRYWRDYNTFLKQQKK